MASSPSTVTTVTGWFFIPYWILAVQHGSHRVTAAQIEPHGLTWAPILQPPLLSHSSCLDIGPKTYRVHHANSLYSDEHGGS